MMFDQAKSGILTLVAVLILIVILLPFFWVISCSLRPFGALFTTTFEIIPENPTLDAFHWVLFESSFLSWFKNSLIVLFLTNVISLSVVLPGGYGFSRFKFRGKRGALYSYFILTQMMGGMAIIGLIGIYILLAHLGLLNSLFILSLIYAASTVPFTTWYFKANLDGLSKEFDEAAIMDGASFWRSLWHVILPLAKPAIFTVIIFTSIGTWGEWVIGGVILSSGNYTVPVGMALLTTGWSTPWNRFAAMSIIYMLPLLILFIIAHRYLKVGLTLGGIKG